MKDPLIWQLLLQVLLIFCNAVFACAEIAVISTEDARLNRLSQQGDKRAKRLVKLTEQPSRFLATIQVAITLSGFLGSAFAADNFAARIVAAVEKADIGISSGALNTVCVILITLILSYFTLVFGELVPKRLAMKNPEGMALGMSGMLSGISRVFSPLVWLLSASTNGVLRLLRVDPAAEDDKVTEEKIRMLIDVGTESGSIDPDEKQMLQNIFEFDDVTAGELATHRTLVNFLWLEDSDESWDETVRGSRHSHYPICRESADDVVGILNAKDYFRLPDRKRETVMAGAVDEPFFVPDSVKADVLFEDMKKRREFFAVVLDEYGGVEGVVSMRDLLEAIVGELLERDDEPDCLLEKLEDGRWRMSGSVPLDDISEALGWKRPSDEFETLGGLIFSALAEVPRDGSQPRCTVAGLEVEVRRIRRHRIEEALVRMLPKEAAEDEETDD